MTINRDLPFEVGQEVEAKFNASGYRGAWFRCQILKIRTTTAEPSLLLKYLDFPDEANSWAPVRHSYPAIKLEAWRREMNSCWMLRPKPAIVHEKDVERYGQKVCTGQERPGYVHVYTHTYVVGDHVDWWVDDCFWSARIVSIDSKKNKAKLRFPPPPLGEGKTDTAPLEDLRPSFSWSPARQWRQVGFKKSEPRKGIRGYTIYKSPVRLVYFSGDLATPTVVPDDLCDPVSSRLAISGSEPEIDKVPVNSRGTSEEERHNSHELVVTSNGINEESECIRVPLQSTVDSGCETKQLVVYARSVEEMVKQEHRLGNKSFGRSGTCWIKDVPQVLKRKKFKRKVLCSSSFFVPESDEGDQQIHPAPDGARSSNRDPEICTEHELVNPHTTHSVRLDASSNPLLLLATSSTEVELDSSAARASADELSGELEAIGSIIEINTTSDDLQNFIAVRSDDNVATSSKDLSQVELVLSDAAAENAISAHCTASNAHDRNGMLSESSGIDTVLCRSAEATDSACARAAELGLELTSVENPERCVDPGIGDSEVIGKGCELKFDVSDLEVATICLVGADLKHGEDAGRIIPTISEDNCDALRELYQQQATESPTKYVAVPRSGQTKLLSHRSCIAIKKAFNIGRSRKRRRETDQLIASSQSVRQNQAKQRVDPSGFQSVGFMQEPLSSSAPSTPINNENRMSVMECTVNSESVTFEPEIRTLVTEDSINEPLTVPTLPGIHEEKFGGVQNPRPSTDITGDLIALERLGARVYALGAELHRHKMQTPKKVVFKIDDKNMFFAANGKGSLVDAEGNVSSKHTKRKLSDITGPKEKCKKMKVDTIPALVETVQKATLPGAEVFLPRMRGSVKDRKEKPDASMKHNTSQKRVRLPDAIVGINEMLSNANLEQEQQSEARHCAHVEQKSVGCSSLSGLPTTPRLSRGCNHGISSPGKGGSEALEGESNEPHKCHQVRGNSDSEVLNNESEVNKVKLLPNGKSWCIKTCTVDGRYEWIGNFATEEAALSFYDVLNGSSCQRVKEVSPLSPSSVSCPGERADGDNMSPDCAVNEKQLTRSNLERNSKCNASESTSTAIEPNAGSAVSIVKEANGMKPEKISEVDEEKDEDQIAVKVEVSELQAVAKADNPLVSYIHESVKCQSGKDALDRVSVNFLATAEEVEAAREAKLALWRGLCCSPHLTGLTSQGLDLFERVQLWQSRMHFQDVIDGDAIKALLGTGKSGEDIYIGHFKTAKEVDAVRKVLHRCKREFAKSFGLLKASGSQQVTSSVLQFQASAEIGQATEVVQVTPQAVQASAALVIDHLPSLSEHQAHVNSRNSAVPPCSTSVQNVITLDDDDENEMDATPISSMHLSSSNARAFTTAMPVGRINISPPSVSSRRENSLSSPASTTNGQSNGGFSSFPRHILERCHVTGGSSAGNICVRQTVSVSVQAGDTGMDPFKNVGQGSEKYGSAVTQPPKEGRPSSQHSSATSFFVENAVVQGQRVSRYGETVHANIANSGQLAVIPSSNLQAFQGSVRGPTPCVPDNNVKEVGGCSSLATSFNSSTATALTSIMGRRFYNCCPSVKSRDADFMLFKALRCRACNHLMHTECALASGRLRLRRNQTGQELACYECACGRPWGIVPIILSRMKEFIEEIWRHQAERLSQDPHLALPVRLFDLRKGQDLCEIIRVLQRILLGAKTDPMRTIFGCIANMDRAIFADANRVDYLAWLSFIDNALVCLGGNAVGSAVSGLANLTAGQF